MKEHKVFVYGTLKRGYGNNYLLDSSRFIGEAVTSGEYHLRDAGIPYLCLQGAKKLPVKGELWSVNDQTLKCLDRLEGHPDFYYRKRIEVNIDGVYHDAYAYTVERAHDGRVAEVNEDGQYEWSRT